MSAPVEQIRVTRATDLDKFVSNINQRIKHSSGLAIHDNLVNNPYLQNQGEKSKVSNVLGVKLSSTNKITTENSKKTFKKFLDNSEERKTELSRISQNVSKVNSQQRAALKEYQKRVSRGNRTIVINVDGFTIEPDPKKVARTRHLYLVGSFPKSLVL